MSLIKLMKAESKDSVSKKEILHFSLIISAGIVIVFGLLFPFSFNLNYSSWPWYIAVIICLFGVISPRALVPLYKGWLIFGHVLGWVNTRLILSVLFFIIFLPIGLCLKLVGKDSMARKFKKNDDTYRVSSVKSDRMRMKDPY